ncbi:MAG: archaeosortase/exosortase family protein [Thermoproteota archaeon]
MLRVQQVGLNPVSRKILGNKHYLFLAALFLSSINPLTVFLLSTSWTFTFAVLFTFIIWVLIKWEDFLKVKSKGGFYEIILGTLLIAGNLLRNIVSTNSFGIFDMLVMLIGLYLIFFGLHATRFFVPLIAYMIILLVGYQLEFLLEQVKVLEYFLASLMGSLLQSLNIVSWVAGNIVIMIDRVGETHNLVIDGPCTGIKGMLAYGSLAALLVFDVKASLRRKLIATSIGLVGTLLVNILRLTLIFLAVYFLGIDAGLLIHTYLGYSLFIIWVLSFWTVAFRYLTPQKHDGKVNLADSIVDDKNIRNNGSVSNSA